MFFNCLACFWCFSRILSPPYTWSLLTEISNSPELPPCRPGQKWAESFPTLPLLPFTHLRPSEESYLVPVVPDFTKICTDCKLKVQSSKEEDCRSARRDTLPLGRAL